MKKDNTEIKENNLLKAFIVKVCENSIMEIKIQEDIGLINIIFSKEGNLSFEIEQ